MVLGSIDLEDRSNVHAQTFFARSVSKNIGYCRGPQILFGATQKNSPKSTGTNNVGNAIFVEHFLLQLLISRLLLNAAIFTNRRKLAQSRGASKIFQRRRF